MKSLIKKFTLFITFFLLIQNCEEQPTETVAQVDTCIALSTVSSDAAMAYQASTLDIALCTANVEAYQSALSSECMGFSTSGLEIYEGLCEQLVSEDTDSDGDGIPDNEDDDDDNDGILDADDGDDDGDGISDECESLIFNYFVSNILYESNDSDLALCTATSVTYQGVLDAGCSSEDFSDEGFATLNAECDVIANNAENTCDEGTGEECATAYVTEANEAFFNFMINGPESGECDNVAEDGTAGEMVQECLNMEEIEYKYDKALEVAPDHKGAIFGKAYMELFQISQDPLLKTTLEEWETCINTFDFGDDPEENEDFDGDSEMPRSIFRGRELELGIPNTSTFFRFDPMRIFNFIPMITSHEDLLLRSSEDCPEISSLQVLLENVFLSRLTSAITKFDQILGVDFVFTITPEMIDDPEGEVINLDDTEIYLMKAFLHQIRAIIYAVITYDVNVPYYDIVDELIEGEGLPTTDMDWSWLSTNSTLLTIRSGQEDSWPNAHADLINVLNSIEGAWNFLESDTNDENDAIQSDMVESDSEDEDNMTVPEVIEELRTILNDVYTLELDFGDCDMECNWIDDQWGGWEDCTEECEENIVEVDLNINNFLTDPPQNLKEILPTFTATTETCEDRDYDYDDGYLEYEITIDISSIPIEGDYNDYWFDGNCEFHDNDEEGGSEDGMTVNFWGSSHEELENQVSSQMLTICNEIVSSNGNSNLEMFNLGFSISAYESNDSGTITMQEGDYYNIETYEIIEWGCPFINFEATTCDEWKADWDYTVGGLFSNMTQSKFFQDIVGEDIDEEDCSEMLEEGIEFGD